MTEAAGGVLPVLDIQRERLRHSLLDKPIASGVRLDCFAMVPWDVLVDSRIEHLDIRIYGIMAACRHGIHVSMGGRRIAKLACTWQSSVVDSLRRLVSCEYVEVVKGPNGARNQYRLTSKYFTKPTPLPEGQQPAAKLNPIARVTKTCSECKRRVRGLGKSGTCRTCLGVQRTEKIADRVARKVVKESQAEPLAALPW